MAFRIDQHALAVLAGAGCGLLSLVMDAPVMTAALRGLGAFVALSVVARIGAAAISSTSGSARAAEAPVAEVER